MNVQLAPEDVEAIHATLERFRKAELAPKVERSEHPLSPTQVQAVCDQVMELGLLNLDDEPGIGLWDSPQDSVARSMTLSSLRDLSRTNPGVAFHIHRLALGAWLSRALQLPAQVPSLPCLQGHWGLGRDALPRLLRGLSLSTEQHTLLADYFVSNTRDAQLITVGEPFQRLLLPSYSDQSLGFVAVSRDACVLQTHEASHGLDELRTASARLPDGARTPCEVGPEGAAQLYAQALSLDCLGIMAVSLGCLMQARDRAAEYAQMRVQGGQTIIGHPAVQQLLGRATSTVAAAQQLLDGAAGSSPTAGALPHILSARAMLQPECCKAANDALQTFGGLGYMQDNGMEKAVRDLNHLRLLNGTPGELRRFAALWESP